MKVALLPSAYAPMIGGVEELTRHLARHLVQAGDEVEVWPPRQEGQAAEDAVDGIPVHRFPMPLPPARVRSLARFPVDGLQATRAVQAAVRRFRPDVLHVQCFSVNGVYATAVSALERVPLVITLQGETLMDDHDIFDRSVGLRTALRVALRRAAAVTGCSQFVLDDAERRFGLAPGSGQVIFNGVDLAEPVEGTVEVPFGRFVLALGRIVWKKGFDLLLDAFAAAADRVEGVGLVIAGDGPYRGRLEARARRLGIEESVWFPGPLGRGAVASAMAAASALVMPSRLEPFGIVVLEGWRAGCPVIVSSIGGTTEFVSDEVDGLLVDPHDREALAGALARLLADPGLGATLAAHAAVRVKDFDWSVVTGSYRDLYQRVRAARAG